MVRGCPKAILGDRGFRVQIKFVEIANFRKLLSIRIDIAEATTLFVGANNSGKTSAILAMRKFLSPRGRPFEVHDITLCRWQAIDAIGQAWVEARALDQEVELDLAPWADLLPSFDLWLQVDDRELHHVRDLTDGLNHASAISFEVDAIKDDGSLAPLLRLPEGHNGLGYQNLISMIFRLMAFRDAWMRVGKAGKSIDASLREPIHLVLVEEPEAHLHAQVQQVFIRKAYDILRAHTDLKDGPGLRTQLIVSTHSSHVAHETSFSYLRYFRRLPAGMGASVPVSSVVNLTEAFGDGTETKRFVTRYLRAQHADLFFADAAIFVEGPAERMLLPNFIRAHYPFLNQCYVTILEIGGSHAHRLRGLIEHLGLLSLIITDLDSLEKTGGGAVQPKPGSNQVTNNATLKSWVPCLTDIDALLVAKSQDKIKRYDPLFEVRAAFQVGL
jgi:predicted ATP-dependent endonuclease of OLD family